MYITTTPKEKEKMADGIAWGRGDAGWAKFLTQKPMLEACDEGMPFMDTTTSEWNDTKISFQYGKLILMFFHQLF
jgi:hypothetical protein